MPDACYTSADPEIFVRWGWDGGPYQLCTKKIYTQDTGLAYIVPTVKKAGHCLPANELDLNGVTLADR